MDEELYEDDPEEQPKRHAALVLLFALIRSDAEDRLRQITRDLGNGELSVTKWAAAFRQEMRDRHAEAVAIGRRLAGGTAAHVEADDRAGEAAWKAQGAFFERFVADLNGDRYDDEEGAVKGPQVWARAKSYIGVLTGTLHWAFVEELGEDLGVWELGDKDHCGPDPKFLTNCPSEAAKPPRPARDFITVPCAGDTPCLGNCDCVITSADGRYSTRGIS